MTTTPGYTVAGLLQAVEERIQRAQDNRDAREENRLRVILARAAELTAERASPAKDGGEQPTEELVKLACNAYDCYVTEPEAIYPAMYAAVKAVLASQIRPQSAVQGWLPIATVPVNKTVALLCAYRHMSDDLLGCGKDIGYLTDGGWFSTCGELRAMSRDAFTHWKAIPPDSLFAAPQPPQGEGNDLP